MNYLDKLACNYVSWEVSAQHALSISAFRNCLPKSNSNYKTIFTSAAGISLCLLVGEPISTPDFFIDFGLDIRRMCLSPISHLKSDCLFGALNCCQSLCFALV